MRIQRRGVASVVGTVIFVIVFMMALGTLAYASGLQTQASAAQERAQQAAAMRSSEALTFSQGATGLIATDSGPASVYINHLILRFPNGTVYTLAAVASVPVGGSTSVQALVPTGVCAPGTATCLSKYNQIVAGNVPGSAVGTVTSLGNSFWYDPAAGLSQGGQAYVESSTVSTTSATLASIPGLGFAGSPGGTYIVSAQLGYYQSVGSSNLVYFGVSAPADAKLLACSDISASSNPYRPSCSPLAGTQLPQPTCYALASNLVCSYSLTVLVVFGPSGGTLQVEFASNGGATAYVTQGSYMLVSDFA